MTDSSNQAEPVRLAIVGCGAVALRCHLPALRNTNEVRVTALVDVDPDRAAAAAEFIATEGLGPAPDYVGQSLDDALQHIEAGIVCTAHTAHGQTAGALLAAKRHVLVEKPLAPTTREAEQLRDQARAAGLVAAVGHVRRLFPATVWVPQVLASGRLGTIRRVTWHEGSAYNWPLATASMFRADLAGGGVTLETGAHVFDILMSWFGNDPELVEYLDDHRGGVESESVTRLRFGSVPAEVRLSRLRDLGNTFEIVGSTGTLRAGTGFQTQFEIVAGQGTPDSLGQVPVTPPAVDAWAGLFAGQLTSFARAIRSGSEPLADADAGVRTTKIAEACYAGRGRGRLTQDPVTPTPAAAADLAGRRVVVTGASGFVGTRAVQRLVTETEAEVVAVVRDYNRLARLSTLDQSALTFAKADLSDPQALAAAMAGADTVIHCAYGNAGTVEERWHTTVDGTRAALNAAKAAGTKRFVLVSSLSVYDIKDVDTITEQSPALPDNPADREYGQQKLNSERIAMAEAGGTIEIVVVQPTVIYGPRGPEWTVRALTRMAADSEVLPSGDQGVCNAVHLDDVVSALMLAATAPDAAGRRFLISGAEPVTWGEFYDAYRSMLPAGKVGGGGTPLQDWERGTYESRAAVRIDAARQVLGFEPAYDLKLGMATVRDWADEQGLLS
jgi:predicted dehydrogenase/nucleoside-diphosphate-sugar epimerase